MNKGQTTKQTILSYAAQLASAVGLSGLTIGQLAGDLKLSKSGLFAHFKSKEALQIATLDKAAERFAHKVVEPCLLEFDAEKRVAALFENWLKWGQSEKGCIFMAASFEFDDQPGAVRDHLVRLQKKWTRIIEEAAEYAVRAGYLNENLDVKQFAYDFYSLGLSFQYFQRLLRDPAAASKVRRSFARLLENTVK